MTTLDQQIDASLQEISKRRKTKLTLVVLGLGVAVGTLIAMTALMYSPSAGNIGEDRIGSESFR